jgi:hypothetical protein
VSLENAHATAERKGRVVIAIVLEDYIVEEALEVEGLLGTNYIKYGILFN